MTAAQIIQALKSAAAHSPALALIAAGGPGELKVISVVWVCCLIENRARWWYQHIKIEKKDALRALEIEAWNERQRKPTPDEPP